MGAILANTSRNRQQIEAVLHSVERPLYFVLLLCGGALWSPGGSGAWFIPVLVFLVARMLSKVYVARLAARFNDMTGVLGPNWGRALIGQGGLALAIAFNYLIESNSYFPDIIFTAAVVSVLLTDLASARLMQKVVTTSPYEIRASGEQPKPALPDAEAEPEPAQVGGQA
jgi:Kef-type K+ transport system membrane component KefB